MKTRICILSAVILLAMRMSSVYSCDTLHKIKSIELRIFRLSDELNNKPDLRSLKIRYASVTTVASFDKDNDIWIAKRPFTVSGREITILDSAGYSFLPMNTALFECRENTGVLIGEFEFKKKTPMFTIAIYSMPRQQRVKSTLLSQEQQTDFKTKVDVLVNPIIFEVEAGVWGGKSFYCPIELSQSGDSLSLDIDRIKEKVMNSDFTYTIPRKNKALLLGEIKLQKVTIKKEYTK